eukprot:gene38960-47032_t
MWARDNNHLRDLRSGITFLLAAPVAYQLCAGPKEWSVACGVKEGTPAYNEMVKRIAVMWVPCCPMRLVQAVAPSLVLAECDFALWAGAVIAVLAADAATIARCTDAASRPGREESGEALQCTIPAGSTD